MANDCCYEGLRRKWRGGEKVIRYYCDNCGKEIIEPDKPISRGITAFGKYLFNPKDCCSNCAKRLEEIFSQGWT